MRTTLIVAASVAATLVVPAAASAHDRADCSTHLERAYSAKYREVRERHGTRAPGRNIRAYGVVRKNQTIRPARCGELRRSLQQLRQLLTVPQYPTLVRSSAPPAQMPSGVQTAAVAPGGTLQAIAQCESSNNPAAVSADGLYTGLYQFDDQTWHSVGGTGRAGDASAGEQTQRAAALYAQRGSAPWPVCGR